MSDEVERIRLRVQPWIDREWMPSQEVRDQATLLARINELEARVERLRMVPSAVDLREALRLGRLLPGDG